MREWRKGDLKINVESVLRGQGADPEIIKSRKPRLFSLAERAFKVLDSNSGFNLALDGVGSAGVESLANAVCLQV